MAMLEHAQCSPFALCKHIVTDFTFDFFYFTFFSLISLLVDSMFSCSLELRKGYLWSDRQEPSRLLLLGRSPIASETQWQRDSVPKIPLGTNGIVVNVKQCQKRTLSCSMPSIRTYDEFQSVLSADTAGHKQTNDVVLISPLSFFGGLRCNAIVVHLTVNCARLPWFLSKAHTLCHFTCRLMSFLCW